MECIHSFRIFCYFLLFVHFIVLSNAASIDRSIGNESFVFERGIGFQTTDKLILQAGYHAETHQVTTKDGFVITFFRILKNEDEFNDISSRENAKHRKTIVLQHGMLCSSSDWVFAGPKRSLGFVLADLGHDVWLTNVRGNIYGRNTTDEKVSWDFSFHEMGKYDLPAQIDYILDKTRAEKLYYIGYSMGTTAFYTMMSIKPKYNSKFKGMISLAPISFLNNVKGIMIRVIKYFSSFINSVLKLFNIRIVFKHPITFNNNNICDYPIIEKICVAFISSICGFDGGQYDKEMVSRYLAITPVGTSWKVAQHYFQLMESGAFRQFDYGSPKNQRLYGQEVPPDYDLEKFKVTVALIQGKNDYLSVFEDARKLLDQLGSYIRIHIKLGNSQFSHADFMWAKDVDTILFPTILHSLDIMGNSTVPSYNLPENSNDYSIRVYNVSSRTHLD